jgi:hypothetical protein
MEENFAAPLIWILEKLCERFPKFDAWLESKLIVKPGKGTESLGPN